MPINEWSDSILIAEVNDEPLFSEEMSNLMQRLDEMTEALPNIIVNMKGVSFLNSTNIAQLLRLRKRLQNSEARLKICSVPDPVWSVLLITGLDKIFDFTDDVSTSLASLQLGI